MQPGPQQELQYPRHQPVMQPKPEQVPKSRQSVIQTEPEEEVKKKTEPEEEVQKKNIFKKKFEKKQKTMNPAAIAQQQGNVNAAAIAAIAAIAKSIQK